MSSVVLFLFVAAEYCIYLWCYFLPIPVLSQLLCWIRQLNLNDECHERPQAHFYGDSKGYKTQAFSVPKL